jgi:hypothetical protein
VPCHTRRRSSGPWSGSAPRRLPRPYDPGGQYGTHAEDLGEGGAGSFHLGFDAPVQVLDLSVQRPDVAQHLRSQPPAQAGRGAALESHATQDARGSVSRERPGHPAGEEVPQEPVQAASSARVRSATRSSRLSESRRSTSEPISGSTAASRPLREAATRRWRGHRAHRSCGRCRSRAPAPVPRAWAERPPYTRRPLPASPPGDDRGHQSSPPPNDARQTVSPSIHKGPQAGAVLREASTLEELASDFVDRSDGDRRLVRIDPDQDLHERRHLRFGRTSAMGAKDIPTLSGVPIPLLDRRGAICS